MIHNANYLYYLHEVSKSQLQVLNFNIHYASELLSYFPDQYNYIAHNYKAFFHLFHRLTKCYDNTAFDIKSININNQEVQICQESILQKPFCDLLHFKKCGDHEYSNQPKLLIVAPLAGHTSVLISESISQMLESCDVYVANWKNARQVELSYGLFDMDTYIDYIIEYIKLLGPNLNIMAVCQPTVPVLAATSILAQEGEQFAPTSLVLMGGPIDARVNPTAVNKFATSQSIDWFESNMIATVPQNYPGYGRKVYPGFMQLISFLNMNPSKHITSHIDLLKDLINCDWLEVQKQEKFYDRYLSVLDLTAEFYLQTIKDIFQDFSMAKGTMTSRGRKIDLSSITKSALLCIEGEHDDITGIGQTKAVIGLCKNISDEDKFYYLQEGAGHYGIFSGGKFRRHIVPIIKDFIHKYWRT